MGKPRQNFCFAQMSLFNILRTVVTVIHILVLQLIFQYLQISCIFIIVYGYNLTSNLYEPAKVFWIILFNANAFE